MTSPIDHAPPKTHVLVEEGQRLSRSFLWRCQRRFFEERGIRAWSDGIVPSFVTSNCTIARAYAEVLCGWLRDWREEPPGEAGISTEHPLYVVELGAGSGRFAYHFLRHLREDGLAGRLAGTRVVYVMTDVSERTIAGWQQNRQLRALVEDGALDFARFDGERDTEISLFSGRVLGAPAAGNPLAVVANYFFDSIPQDAFRVDEGQLSELLPRVTSPEPEPDLDDPAILARFHLDYEARPIGDGYYGDPELDPILEGYRTCPGPASFLFPAAAIGCLGRLRHLAGGRLLLLSGDKGQVRADQVLLEAPPHPAFHGSLSFSVNYHALTEHVRRTGGQVLQTAHQHQYLNVVAGVLGPIPGALRETSHAFAEHIERRGPDDAFALKKLLDPQLGALDLRGLLLWLRGGGNDADQFVAGWQRLLTLVDEAPNELRADVVTMLDEVWANYLFIGEEDDVAFSIGLVLQRMNLFSEAAVYFRRSLEMRGPDAATLYNLAYCCCWLGEHLLAVEQLEQALALKPAFAPAEQLRREILAGRPGRDRT